MCTRHQERAPRRGDGIGFRRRSGIEEKRTVGFELEPVEQLLADDSEVLENENAGDGLLPEERAKRVAQRFHACEGTGVERERPRVRHMNV